MVRKPAAVATRAAIDTGIFGGYPRNASASRKMSHALHIAMRCVTAVSRPGESFGSPVKSSTPADHRQQPRQRNRAQAIPNASSGGQRRPGVNMPTTSAATAQLQNTMGKCTSIGCTGWPNNRTRQLMITYSAASSVTNPATASNAWPTTNPEGKARPRR